MAPTTLMASPMSGLSVRGRPSALRTWFVAAWSTVLGVSALGVLTASAAWAADPVAGQTKFTQNCASCHTVASTSTVDRGRNNPAMIQNAINNVGAMNAALSGRVTATDLADIAAWLGNSPAALSFAQTTVGQASAVSTVTVTASRQAALGSLGATASGDFAVQGGTCTSTLASGTSCTVGVVFNPTTTGARSGTLAISHNGISTPVQVALTGTGAAAAAQAGLGADSTALDFGTQAVGASTTARTVTLTNTGSAALSFSAITLGGAQATDFTRAGTCAVGTPLAVGATCTVTSTFAPTAAGARAATVTVTGNVSSAGGSGTAQITIALSGVGQAATTPVATLSTGALAFGAASVGGTSPGQTVQLTNTGSAALTLSAAATAAPFAVTHDCGGSVAAGGQCTLTVTFSPTGAGVANGSLNLTSNASASPQSVTLVGTGVVGNVAALAWSGATGADFATTVVGADATLRHVTLTNNGTAAATLGSFAIAGAAAADFRVDTSATCVAGQSLAVGASCDVAIGFSPRAAGNRTASLAVVADNAGLPMPLPLTGTGQGAAQPVLQLSATSLTVGAGDAGAQTLTLTNSGNGVLTISALNVSGGSFTVDGTGSNGCGAAPFTVQPGASCRTTVRWQGSAVETGTLTLQGNMSPATTTVALSSAPAGAAVANSGGGGCTIGAGSGAVDPLLLVMAGIAALVLWRRRRR